MYRSVLVVIIVVAAACKGGANAASVANTNSATADTPVVAQTSDTGATVAGPISTTGTPAPGSAEFRRGDLQPLGQVKGSNGREGSGAGVSPDNGSHQRLFARAWSVPEDLDFFTTAVTDP